MKRSEFVIVLWVLTLAIAFEAGVAIWGPPAEGPFETTLLQRPFSHQRGNAYLAKVSLFGAKADQEGDMRLSTVQLYENGKLLGPQHISSDDIAREGRGLYLHWRGDASNWIVFSASDNSDPNTNGRTYRVFDPQARDQ